MVFNYKIRGVTKLQEGMRICVYQPTSSLTWRRKRVKVGNTNPVNLPEKDAVNYLYGFHIKRLNDRIW